MDLSIAFGLLIIVDAMAARFIPAGKTLTRFAARSLFFALETVLIVSLIGSPFRPVYKPTDVPREVWLQILLCVWWILLSRELILFLRLHTALRKTSTENKLLFDVIGGSIYICAALAMMSFVFGLPLKGLVATSGVIAIVLGLALQSTLGDLFSGISLSIEKPFYLGDEILLDGGVEGEVVQMNWRATHIKNGANDIVVIPNSSIAKMRIQNHSTGSKQHSASLTVVVNSLNGPEMVLEVLKQAAMTCPSIVERPAPSVAATLFLGDRITYEIYFNTSTFTSTGNARSELITQLYKRASPATSPVEKPVPATTNQLSDLPILFYSENQAIDHISIFETLSSDERRSLNQQAIRHHFRSGDRLLKQGDRVESVYFIFSGIVQVIRQIQDGRELNARKLGPGDYYAEYSLLTGVESQATFTALTSGVLLEWNAAQLKPILVARPELADYLSLSLVRVQQLLATFDKDALHQTETHQNHLLSRIKDFFHVDGTPKRSFPHDTHVKGVSSRLDQ
jgi:small-conductance mechanosensitive channel/CRP-like cAMP-binding protein